MQGMTNNHGNLNINYCAAILLKSVRENPVCEISKAREIVTAQIGYEISYMKAWYTLKRCRENVYGTWESSVQKLPKFMKALQQRNTGTTVEWEHHATNHPSKFIIKYVFWAFKPCIDGFKYCRRVISVDGTHLYTKYKHKMLLAVCLDANQQVLPLAYAIVDEETASAWKWFFKCIDKHLLSGISDGICIISDRGTGILSAIDSMPEFRPPRITHRFCLRHVCSNVNAKFKSIVVKDFCYAAGKQSQVWKLNRYLDKIGEENPNALRYLMNMDREKWTLAHDGGSRRGQLTTNLSESINGALKGARKLPVTAIVDFTFHRVVKHFINRVAKGNKWEQLGQRWAEFPLKKFKLWEEHSTTHYMRRFNTRNYAGEVFTRAKPQGGGGKTHCVDLRAKECSCNKWTLFGIPCSHVQHVCRDFRLDAETLVAEYYSVRNHKNTYSGVFHPLLPEMCWEDADFELFHDVTLRKATRRGRPESSRIRNEMDRPQARARRKSRATQESH
ncbi:PREDICTED: uncharacterized protein LOC105954952 [Erythranthe guttata]|uniref:uncharacterized protein LOC105954952 n=1 Tax=Erythranthe guttata TaxID=4155 RepID=UPI00064E0560|nr:PREDICTED: uncharacterized protein LOC105954952 [Erythranthe guttata]|eukprot:XP_012834091.1 PREDICTED: uncharacterized protein LOC105954952 [Erythranthe guttata]